MAFEALQRGQMPSVDFINRGQLVTLQCLVKTNNMGILTILTLKGLTFLREWGAGEDYMLFSYSYTITAKSTPRKMIIMWNAFNKNSLGNVDKNSAMTL